MITTHSLAAAALSLAVSAIWLPAALRPQSSQPVIRNPNETIQTLRQAQPSGCASHEQVREESQTDESMLFPCSAAVWPLRDSAGAELKHFERLPQIPRQNWQRGHRGLDVSASPGASIIAPFDGIIVFAGKVGGKDALSIRAPNGITLTFEPAESTVAQGTKVHRGEDIGAVSGHSDHCDNTCAHIGAKKNGTYIDPRMPLELRRIILKPQPD